MPDSSRVDKCVVFPLTCRGINLSSEDLHPCISKKTQNSNIVRFFVSWNCLSFFHIVGSEHSSELTIPSIGGSSTNDVCLQHRDEPSQAEPNNSVPDCRDYDSSQSVPVFIPIFLLKYQILIMSVKLIVNKLVSYFISFLILYNLIGFSVSLCCYIGVSNKVIKYVHYFTQVMPNNIAPGSY